jgi:hypothetical protein
MHSSGGEREKMSALIIYILRRSSRFYLPPLRIHGRHSYERLDMTSWLGQMQQEMDGCLADLAQVSVASEEN